MLYIIGLIETNDVFKRCIQNFNYLLYKTIYNLYSLKDN